MSVNTNNITSTETNRNDIHKEPKVINLMYSHGQLLAKRIAEELAFGLDRYVCGLPMPTQISALLAHEHDAIGIEVHVAIARPELGTKETYTSNFVYGRIAASESAHCAAVKAMIANSQSKAQELSQEKSVSVSSGAGEDALAQAAADCLAQLAKFDFEEMFSSDGRSDFVDKYIVALSGTYKISFNVRVATPQSAGAGLSLPVLAELQFSDVSETDALFAPVATH